MKSFALSLAFIMIFTADLTRLIFIFDHAWIRYQNIFAHNAAKATTVTVRLEILVISLQLLCL